MMNGFDGYAEEIIDFASHFPTRPFDIIAFDGPGQGHTALAGMTLEPEWEHPTNAVLDYFGVESAAALGVSFGGYLVMRAAAHCSRISHVIDVPAPRRPDAVTTSSSASHRGRGHREPETRVAHRRGAAHRAEVQRGPDVEATAGQTPHGPEQTERGTAGVR